MYCTLPEWAVHTVMIAMILVAGGAGFWVMQRIGETGRRRHPRMDFDDHHRRRNWGAVGVLVGVFVVFPAAAIAFGEIARPVLCEVVGDWRPPPDLRLPTL